MVYCKSTFFSPSIYIFFDFSSVHYWTNVNCSVTDSPGNVLLKHDKIVLLKMMRDREKSSGC